MFFSLYTLVNCESDYHIVLLMRRYVMCVVFICISYDGKRVTACLPKLHRFTARHGPEMTAILFILL